MNKSSLITLLLFLLCSPLALANDLDKAADAINNSDYETAKKLLVPMAKSGDAEAQYLLGGMFVSMEEGEKALEWLTKSADAGHYQAATTLGKMYASGHGVKLDIEEASKWFQRASDILIAEGEEEAECE